MALLVLITINVHFEISANILIFFLPISPSKAVHFVLSLFFFPSKMFARDEKNESVQSGGVECGGRGKVR